MDIVFEKSVNFNLDDIVKNFNYADTKLAFDQGLEYLNIKHSLFHNVPHKKSDLETLIKKIKECNQHRHIYDGYVVINENGKDIIFKLHLQTSTKKTQFKELTQILSVDECFDVLAELYLHNPQLDVKDIYEKCSFCYMIPDLIRLFLKACGKPFGIRYKYLAITIEADIVPVLPPDNKFNHVLIYIDRNTSFVHLRPLRSESSEEVAHELFNIFCDFGAPKYLDKLSEQHLEKLLEVMQSLDVPSLTPTSHFARKPHKLHKIKICVENMLEGWMKLSGSHNWAMGLHAVQWSINTNEVLDTYIRSNVVGGLILSPYHGLFGMQPHTELVEIHVDPNKPPSKPVAEKVSSNCSQCNMPMYKVYKCHYCRAVCHFWCCERTVQETIGTPTLMNICPSCVDKYRSVEVTVVED